jgi:hypothetical protein
MVFIFSKHNFKNITRVSIVYLVENQIYMTAMIHYKVVDLFLCLLYLYAAIIRVMMFTAAFNNISVISWRSVLFVEETGENHRIVASHWQTLSHNVVSSTPSHAYSCNYETNITVTDGQRIAKKNRTTPSTQVNKHKIRPRHFPIEIQVLS